MRQHLLLPGGDFEPADFADCKLWLRADGGNFTKDGSNLISQWDDLSGQGNHALNAGADATKPAFSADEISAGVGAAVFDGTNDKATITNDASLVLGTGDFTYVFAMKLTTPDTSGTPFVHTATGNGTGGGTSHGYDLFHRNTARIQATINLDGTQYTQDFTGLASPRVLTLITRVDRSGFMRTYLDGVAHGTPRDISSQVAFSIGAPASGVMLAELANGSSDWDSAMAEVILYKRLLTVGETNTLGEYMAARYGTSWTDVTA
jgi:hypothetical protein